MANESEILEGNILIAKFMGATVEAHRVYHEDGFDNPYQCTLKGKPMTHVENLSYHYSWNWLMPVVEKIESMVDPSVDHEGKFEIFIFKRCCDIQTEKGTDHMIEVTGAKDKISAVYGAVVMFIKWYNANQ